MPGDAPAIVAAARAWLGVPWRHQGCTRQGVDRAGLVVLVGRWLGLADYDTTAYGRRPDGLGFVRKFRAAVEGIPLPEAGPGDVLVLADAA
jgi:cell wall-associated NlpC family hydrolase